MKFIFTDIDGVLNPHWKRNGLNQQLLFTIRYVKSLI